MAMIIEYGPAVWKLLKMIYDLIEKGVEVGTGIYKGLKGEEKSEAKANDFDKALAEELTAKGMSFDGKRLAKMREDIWVSKKENWQKMKLERKALA